jgi:FkbM family methyltransferase
VIAIFISSQEEEIVRRSRDDFGMKIIVKLTKDFIGLLNICGTYVAVRWFLKIICNLKSIVNLGNLQPADRAMGSGPFKINLRRYGCQFMISGPQAISGIREMYVRDIYLRDGWLKIKPGDTVLDLGANMGNFCNLSLAVDKNVHVVALEPSRYFNKIFYESIGLNSGFLERTTLIRGFIGQIDQKQKEIILRDENYTSAEWLSEEEIIRRADLKCVDFLKCDIEGGEFLLLIQYSKLLAMTKALACEVHAFAGNVSRFIADIKALGFAIGPIQYGPDGSATFLAKRNGGVSEVIDTGGFQI